MSVLDTTELAKQITQHLVRLQELRREKMCVERKIEELEEESQSKKEELNNIEQEIRSIQYEINESLSDKPVELKVVRN